MHNSGDTNKVEYIVTAQEDIAALWESSTWSTPHNASFLLLHRLLFSYMNIPSAKHINPISYLAHVLYFGGYLLGI